MGIALDIFRKIRAQQDYERGIVDGREQGMIEGREQIGAEWEAWLAAVEAAEAKGITFDDPPPSRRGKDDEQ